MHCAQYEWNLRGAQHVVDEWITQFEEGYWSPLSNLARLTEEVGELAREINHQYGEKKKRSDEKTNTISNELGDIIWTILCIANSLNIDMDEAFLHTVQKVRQRDAQRFVRRQPDHGK